jgi:ABC-2 type transport system ATP-binding protein
VIEINHLSKQFGGHLAVDDLTFTLVPGEILGFLGPNGAGKSTTMKMLTGFLRPSGGQVKILGTDMWTDSLTAKRHIGYLPEGAPAYEEMTPRDFLRFVGEARGLQGTELDLAVARVIETMSLQTVLNQKIETLSKGFKRRVGLAQAILHDPDVLILDEPTDGLDPNQKHQVREMIKGLSSDKIVIISTHILEEVTAVCNRVMVLAAGKIVSDGTPLALQEMSRYHGAVLLELDDENESEPVAAMLQSLPMVRDVEVSDAGILVFAQAQDRDILPDINEAVREAGWGVRSVHRERGHLDEVFRKLTEGVAA